MQLVNEHEVTQCESLLTLISQQLTRGMACYKNTGAGAITCAETCHTSASPFPWFAWEAVVSRAALTVIQHNILLPGFNHFAHATGFQGPRVRGFAAFIRFQTEGDRPLCITVPSDNCIDADSNSTPQAFCACWCHVHSYPSRFVVQQHVLTRACCMGPCFGMFCWWCV